MQMDAIVDGNFYLADNLNGKSYLITARTGILNNKGSEKIYKKKLTKK